MELIDAKRRPKVLDRGRSRNSWNVKILGQEVLLDEKLKLRVRRAEILTCSFALIGLTLFIVGAATNSINIKLACGFVTLAALFSLGMVYYKNVSLTIFQRLLKEPNVIVVFILGACNMIIDCSKPADSLSPIMGLIYLLTTYGVMLIDIIKVKSRAFALILCAFLVILNIYNTYSHTFGIASNGIKLATYNIQGVEYVLWKRSIQRSIYIEIFLFSMSGIWVCIKDKDMKLLMFATSNVYRSSGTEKNISEIDDEGEEDDEEDNSIVLDRVGSKSGTARKMQHVRNSWAANYGPDLKSIKLLGVKVALDDNLQWRVYWGQRGAGAFFFFGVVCFVLGSVLNIFALGVVAVLSGAITSFCHGVVLYKNVSFTIFRRLLQEPNVVVVFMLGIFNWFLNFIKGTSIISPINGFIYLLIILANIFVDTIRIKSRAFVIAVCNIFVLLNMYNLYSYTLGDSNNGVTLAVYSAEGQPVRIWLRSTHRSIFLQVLLFSARGIWVMIFDKKMELMMFGTGKVYRNTGTASPN